MTCEVLGTEFKDLEEIIESITSKEMAEEAVDSLITKTGWLRWYTDFMHTYGLCAIDRRQIKKKFQQDNKTIFDMVTVSDQAYIVLFLSNKIPCYKARMAEARLCNDPIMKKKILKKQNGARWTNPTKNRGLKAFDSGWDKAGMKFYHQAMDLFRVLNSKYGDLLVADAREWWRALTGDDDTATCPTNMHSSILSVCYSLSGKYRKHKDETDKEEDELEEYSVELDDVSFDSIDD